MADQETRPERTGWRDETISRWHRTLGTNCPAVDIDFLMCEYDSEEPCCLVEYKYVSAEQKDLNDPTYRTLIRLGERAILPVFEVRWTHALSDFRVWPLNHIAEIVAKRLLATEERDVVGRYRLSRDAYVKLLYGIRHRAIPASVLKAAQETHEP